MTGGRVVEFWGRPMDARDVADVAMESAEERQAGVCCMRGERVSGLHIE